MNNKFITSIILGGAVIGGVVAMDASTLTLEEAHMTSVTPSEKFITEFAMEPKYLTAYSKEKMDSTKAKADFTKLEILVLEEVMKGREIQYRADKISPAEYAQIYWDIAIKLGAQPKDLLKGDDLYKVVRELVK